MNPNEEQVITLPDGRQLGYAEYGSPLGTPLVYFHGWPSSRIEARFFEKEGTARRLNVRLIAVDRPGFGLSSFLPERRFVDWPHDIDCLADQLHLDRFAMMSYSAGSPYALACAAFIPDRLTSVGVVSGLGKPLTERGATEKMPTILLWTSARIHPRLTTLMFNLMKNTLANAPRDQLPKSAKQAMMAEADYQFILQHPQVNGENLDGGVEAIRGGGYGPAYDASLYWKPWGFNLADIRIPIHLWHGEDDINAPFRAHGQYLANTLPNACPHFYRNEGHISLLHRHAEEILFTLTG